MRNRCPDHKIIGYGILKGYRWMISTRGYANIVKSEPDEVHGIVYKISDRDEKRLDCCEGVRGGSYRKEIMIVGVGGQSGKCLVYVDPIMQEGKPNSEYIKRMNKGISDAKLDAQYIDKYIRKFIPAKQDNE